MELPVLVREPSTPVVRAAFHRTQWVWHHEVAAFFERLKPLPEDALHWQPGRGRTIARILIHIGSVVWYYQDALHAGLPDTVPLPTWGDYLGDEWRAYHDEAYYVRRERAWYERFLQDAYEGYMNVVPGITDADLERICTTMSGKQRTVEWILHQVPGHADYHIGQVNYILGRFSETSER